MSKPDVRDFTQEEMSDLSAFITRTLLAAGASDHIRYESKGNPGTQAPGPLPTTKANLAETNPVPAAAAGNTKTAAAVN